MNGIGIHSNEGNAVLKFERKKKEKRERNERNHNDIPYCDFITAELILFGSESLRIAFRFRGVKTPAANTPNTLDPFPFFSAAGYALSSLSSPGSIPFRPQLFPSPSRKNRKNLKAPLNRVHVSPGFSNASFFSSRFFFLFFLLSPFVSLFATRVRVFRFTERVSRDVTPAFFRSSFFLARSLLLPFFRGTLCPGNRANQSFRNERRRRRRRFSRLRLFLCRCCRLSTPLDT